MDDGACSAASRYIHEMPSWTIGASTHAAALVIAGWLAFHAVSDGLAAEFTSYAIVRDDASLVVRGRLVRLFGLYIPDDERICKFFVRPASCGARAAVALDFRITGFITCREVVEHQDGSIDAICYADRSRFDEGTDLGAYLIRKGLALALPDAPFEYHALEKIARAGRRGVWGFPVDTIIQPRR